MPSDIEIRVLGDLAVARSGVPLALPPSKKTRALLAYLALQDRPQRRERLCEIFWDIPDDPRGALRWSLTKLRQLLGPDHDGLIVADRNVVSLRREEIEVDATPLLSMTAQEAEALDTDRLEELASRFGGAVLADLSLPRCPEFEAWRTAIADELDVLRIRILRLLVERLGEEPGRALRHAHALAALLPDDEALAARIRELSEAARHEPHSAERVSAPEAPAVTQETPPPPAPALTQEIRHCTTRDGVKLAYALSGDGPPLVKAANWLSHLEHDWNSPLWQHWMTALSAGNRLIRYDERGNGLSDWDVEDLGFEAMVADLESIVDAAGLRRFWLLGVSQGCAISVAYAARHPARVAGMILYGGYVQGWRARGGAEEVARRQAMGTLMREGWGRQDPLFRQMFTSLFVPGATPEQMDWFNELQRVAVSPENAVRLNQAFGDIDVAPFLPRVSVPTLVIHARDDKVVPVEQGRALAEGIEGARFVELDSGNHILLEQEPAFEVFLGEMRRFMAEEQPVPQPSPAPVSGAPELVQARRQVTVLAAELVGTAEDIDETDPERLVHEIEPALAHVVTIFEAHHGVVSLAADGVVTATFGLARATEEHTYLACRAALAAQAALREMGAPGLRAAICNGDVVARHTSTADGVAPEVVGVLPRLAARLMRGLDWPIIALTGQARASAGGYVQAVPMPPGSCPDIGGRRIWQLVGQNRALSRWYLRNDQGLTKLVGRRGELAMLRAVWRRTREGHGHAVGVVADPGLGKSRLVHEFISRTEVASFAVIESGALEFDANVSLQVVRKLVRSALGINEEDLDDAAEDRLTRRQQELELPEVLLAPLRFLLDLPVAGDDWSRFEAAERLERIAEAVSVLACEISRRTPLVVLIEDLHWVDPGSAAVLDRFAESIAPHRVMLVATYRPEHQPNWARLGVFQQLRLEPFGEAETATFLDVLMGEDESLEEVKRLLSARADQTPLFLEETVRALADKGDIVGEPGAYRAARRIEDIAVPASVHAIIAARIDRLERQDQELLQVAAVIGKDVPAELLRALSPLSDTAFAAAIKHLQSQEFLFELQRIPTVHYTFKHALTHRVAYDTLLAPDRKALHIAALRFMEKRHAEALTEHVEKLAEHALRGEEWDTAIRHLLAAADRAIERSAYDTAARHLEKAQAAVEAMPESPERLAFAIDVCTRMRPVYGVIGEYARIVEPLAKARAFATELGDRERLCQILTHQSYFNSTHGQVDEALQAAAALREVAEQGDVDARHLCEADLSAAQAHLMRADALAALPHLEPHRHVFHGERRHERFGQLGTRAVWYFGHLAQAMATLGRFREADEAAGEAMRVADEVGRLIDAHAAHYFNALVQIMRGPDAALLEKLRELTGGPVPGSARSLRPWLMATLGHAEFALGELDSACATLEASLVEVKRFALPQFECYARAVLAAALGAQGREDARNEIEAAVDDAHIRRDHWSEVLALRGLAAIGKEEDAPAVLERACRISEDHGNRPELMRTLEALARVQARLGLAEAAGSRDRARALREEMGLETAGGAPTDEAFDAPPARSGRHGPARIGQ